MAGFKLFIAPIDIFFLMELNKGAFCYILRKFEEFLSISGRENTSRVTRCQNVLCRICYGKIRSPQQKQVSAPFIMQSAEYYLKIRCSDSSLYSISQLFCMFAHRNDILSLVKFTSSGALEFEFAIELNDTSLNVYFCFGAKIL